jgi:hypothetical protein
MPLNNKRGFLRKISDFRLSYPEIIILMLAWTVLPGGTMFICSYLALRERKSGNSLAVN